MKDYYEIFDLPFDCSNHEIKQRYRKLCLQYHPDKNEEGTHERFLEIQEAYETLSNPDKRQLYTIQRFIPWFDLSFLDTHEKEYIHTYSQTLLQSKEFKFAKLLYRSLPPSCKQRIQFLWKRNQSNKHRKEEKSIYEAPKYIYIDQLYESKVIHVYVSIQDAYQNKQKRIIVFTKNGLCFLFLRYFQTNIHIENQTGTLTICLHTQNGKQCFRKKDDLYYLIPRNNPPLFVCLPDQTIISVSKQRKGFGFWDESYQKKGDLIFVRTT